MLNLVDGIFRGNGNTSARSHVAGQGLEDLREGGAAEIVDVDSGNGLPVEANLAAIVDADAAQSRGAGFVEERLSDSGGVASSSSSSGIVVGGVV